LARRAGQAQLGAQPVPAEGNIQQRRAPAPRQVIGQRLHLDGQFLAFGYQPVQGGETAAFRQRQAAHFPTLPPLSTSRDRGARATARQAGQGGRSKGSGLMPPDYTARRGGASHVDRRSPPLRAKSLA
jgi:hypothetical protein